MRGSFRGETKTGHQQRMLTQEISSSVITTTTRQSVVWETVVDSDVAEGASLGERAHMWESTLFSGEMQLNVSSDDRGRAILFVFFVETVDRKKYPSREGNSTCDDVRFVGCFPGAYSCFSLPTRLLDCNRFFPTKFITTQSLCTNRVVTLIFAWMRCRQHCALYDPLKSQLFFGTHTNSSNAVAQASRCDPVRVGQGGGEA